MSFLARGRQGSSLLVQKLRGENLAFGKKIQSPAYRRTKTKNKCNVTTRQAACKTNTIQLHCLCVEKFTFRVVICIKRAIRFTIKHQQFDQTWQQCPVNLHQPLYFRQPRANTPACCSLQPTLFPSLRLYGGIYSPSQGKHATYILHLSDLYCFSLSLSTGTIHGMVAYVNL